MREGDPIHGGGRVDLATGQVWPQTLYEDFRADESEEEEEEGAGTRWLWVDPVGSRSGYRDMEVFIETLEDEHLARYFPLRSAGKVLSADSRTRLHAIQRTPIAGTHSAKTASAAALAHGWQPRATRHIQDGLRHRFDIRFCRPPFYRDMSTT